MEPDEPQPEDPSDPPSSTAEPSTGSSATETDGAPGAAGDLGDLDERDQSSGACGCIVAAVVMLILVLAVYAFATQRDGPSTCTAAWDEVAALGPDQTGPDVYRPTLLACTSVAEWDAENVAHGARTSTGPAAIDGLCRALNVSSELCTAASDAS